MEALIPYLDHLDEITIYELWELCNEKSWFDLRRKVFDGRVSVKYGRVYTDERRIFESLDKMIENNYISWIDRWIEDCIKSGSTREEVIGTIGRWLETQNTVKALQLAAMAVTQIGRRQDVQILNVAIEPQAAADALRADTTFAVRRRSLG